MTTIMTHARANSCFSPDPEPVVSAGPTPRAEVERAWRFLAAIGAETLYWGRNGWSVYVPGNILRSDDEEELAPDAPTPDEAILALFALLAEAGVYISRVSGRPDRCRFDHVRKTWSADRAEAHVRWDSESQKWVTDHPFAFEDGETDGLVRFEPKGAQSL